MDANGTHLHLLQGEGDWGPCFIPQDDPQAPVPLLREFWFASPPDATSPLYWDRDRAEVTLRPVLFRYKPARGNIAPTLNDRRGAARDRYGNWYWLAANGLEILVNSEGTGTTSHFWSAGDGLRCDREPNSAPGIGEFRAVEQPARPAALLMSGLAVTDDHYLVVGVLEPAGLLVFDLYAGGPPIQLTWPTPHGASPNFVPFDMAPAPGGGVWVLDRRNQRYWEFDARLRVLKRDMTSPIGAAPSHLDDFQPRDGSSPRRTCIRTFPDGIHLSGGSPLAARDPIAIESLPDRSVLILDNNPGGAGALVYRYRDGRQVGAAVPLMLDSDSLSQSPLAREPIRAHDIAFVPEHTADSEVVPDRLYAAAASGDQCFAFAIELVGDNLRLAAQADYLPMRLFAGRGVVRAGDQAYYDSTDRWVPLAPQRRPRFSTQATLCTPPRAAAHSPLQAERPPFDAREPGCVWHRVMLDACIPPETEVRIWSRAADDPALLLTTPWQAEPPLHQRSGGSELPFVARRTAPGDGTWELLLQNAKGRFLQLKLQLTGNGRATPRLRSLRVYYPRFSYLTRYLPAVYREDRASALFLDRDLANPEGLFTALEDHIAAVQMIFDSDSAPADALAWLAGWFGVALDPQWDDCKRRLFLKYAMKFFQYRGTIRGLQIALHLVHDDCVDDTLFDEPVAELARVPNLPKGQSPTRPNLFRIVEQFRARQVATPAGRWQPEQGGQVLHQRFNQAQAAAKIAPEARTQGFPVRPPTLPQLAALWQNFAQATLGFVPTTAAADVPRWQGFLERRYHALSAWKRAHSMFARAFTVIGLPSRLPADGAPLQDWFDFHTVVLPRQRSAHRFTVLLPVPKNTDPDGREHQRRLELTQRVVAQEKPAHTVFDVKFYWAYFRVGQVCLGEDSVIDRGSRTPDLLPPMVLGRNYLAASYLAPAPPQDARDRQIVGRDRLGR